MNFNVCLRKTCVIAVDADTKEEALERVCDPDEDFDGAWNRAEIEVCWVEEEKST